MLAFFPVLIPRPDARVIQFALSGIRSFMVGPDHAAPRYDANESSVQNWVASKVSIAPIHANPG